MGRWEQPRPSTVHQPAKPSHNTQLDPNQSCALPSVCCHLSVCCLPPSVSPCLSANICLSVCLLTSVCLPNLRTTPSPTPTSHVRCHLSAVICQSAVCCLPISVSSCLSAVVCLSFINNCYMSAVTYLYNGICLLTCVF